jgi:hypothetical protein
MFTVSRRVLLAGGGGTVLANLLQTDRASAARETATLDRVAVKHLLTQRVECFSQDFATAFGADSASVIELGAASEVAAGTRAVVEFDERMFAAGKPTLFTRGTLRSVSAEKTEHNGRIRVEFEIDRGFGGSEEAIGVGLPMTPRPLYPTENLGELQPAILTVTAPGSASSETFDLLGTVTPRTVAPWGVEVSGAWDTIRVRELKRERSYRAPSLVRVLSIGPGPVPTGTATVTVDGNLIEQLDIEEARIDGETVDPSQVQLETSRIGTELRVEVRTGFEIPAGSALQFSVNPVGRGERPTVSEGIVFARADFTATPDDARPRRSTGRDTFIDVTESGTVEQSDAAEGTV